MGESEVSVRWLSSFHGHHLHQNLVNFNGERGEGRGRARGGEGAETSLCFLLLFFGCILCERGDKVVVDRRRRRRRRLVRPGGRKTWPGERRFGKGFFFREWLNFEILFLFLFLFLPFFKSLMWLAMLVGRWNRFVRAACSVNELCSGLKGLEFCK